MKHLVCVAMTSVVLVNSAVARAEPNTMFESGWESGSILDGGAWGASGGGGGSVVSSERHDGQFAVQVTYLPNGSINGPGWRIEKTFPASNEIYARWRVKYSPNWVWGNNEHKVLIVGDPTGKQNVYFNVFADGQRGGQGRINVYLATVDSNFKAADSDPKMTPGVWHLCELHVVAGTNGRIEAKLDGVLLTLSSGPGTHNPLNVNTGPSIGYIKPDTTYNDYAYPSSLNLTMHSWYDSVALSTQGWANPGPLPPRNILGPLPPTNLRGPLPPTNLRIIN